MDQSKEAEKQRIIAEVQSLQGQISKLNKDLIALQSSTEQKSSTLKKSYYTLNELAALPAETRTYKFLLTPLKTLETDLTAQTKQLDADVLGAKPRQTALEKQLKDTQTNLKEVIDGAKSL